MCLRSRTRTRSCCFFFQAEDGIRAPLVTGGQTCALPISALIRDGLDSRRTACAAAGATVKKAAATANKMSAQRFRRPGRMTFLFAKNGEKLRESWVTAAGRKLYSSRGGLLFHSGAAARTTQSPRPADERKKFAGETEAESGRNHSCELI